MVRTKARLPRGLFDRGSGEILATQKMVSIIRKVFERYGFDPIETPAIEFTDALGKFLPDQDRPNEGVFSFQDDDEQWLSLRYDLTAPLARYVAEHFDKLPKPFRSYRQGYVFRNEKPGPGRFRQFMQFDADTVGSSSPAADAEMCMLAADTMTALGLKDFQVRVSSRRLLDRVLDHAAIDYGQRLTVLRAIDKLDRLGTEGVAMLLGTGRRDESGDFTKGANLTAAQAEQILSLLVGQHELTDDLRAILDLVDDRVQFDPTVVRGLEYYTGAVFEVTLPGVAGSVGGGGRYDGLVSRFRPEVTPATGFSVGVSRLVAALTTGATVPAGPVIVAVFDRDRLADYRSMVNELHAADIRAEMYLGNAKGMGAQFKYADRRNSPCVVIQGSDEAAAGAVQIRDLRRGIERAEATDREEYQRMQGEAQRTVQRVELVEEVRKVLASRS
jgi:histidyl-tRNA synthetase